MSDNIVTHDEIYPEPPKVPDYSYGIAQNTIDATISLRNYPVKKYCLLSSSGGSLSAYETNDSGMNYGSSKILITKSGLYIMVFSMDISVTSGTTIAQANLYVNGIPVETTLYQNYYTNSARMVIPGSKIANLSSGDLLSLDISGTNGSVNYNYSTYLQVVEL